MIHASKCPAVITVSKQSVFQATVYSTNFNQMVVCNRYQIIYNSECVPAYSAIHDVYKWKYNKVYLYTVDSLSLRRNISCS